MARELSLAGCERGARAHRDCLWRVVARGDRARSRGGTAPDGVAEIGLPVNPIHVLDLALLLPLTLMTGVAHWKRRPFGLLFATPLLVFFAIMDCAIISMTYFMRARGVPASLAIVPVMLAGLLISGALSVLMLRDVHPPRQTLMLPPH
jgi:uncharacterized integral membrane protein